MRYCNNWQTKVLLTGMHGPRFIVAAQPPDQRALPVIAHLVAAPQACMESWRQEALAALPPRPLQLALQPAPGTAAGVPHLPVLQAAAGAAMLAAAAAALHQLPVEVRLVAKAGLSVVAGPWVAAVQAAEAPAGFVLICRCPPEGMVATTCSL